MSAERFALTYSVRVGGTVAWAAAMVQGYGGVGEGALLGFSGELAARMEEEGDTEDRAHFLVEHPGR